MSSRSTTAFLSVLLRAAGVFAVAGVGAAGGHLAGGALGQSRTDWRRITVDGAAVSSEAQLRQALTVSAHHRLAQRVRIAAPSAAKPGAGEPDMSVVYTYADLGFSAPLDEAVARGVAAATTSSLLGTLTGGRVTCAVLLDPCTPAVDIAPAFALDDARIMTELGTLKDRSDSGSVSARLDLENHAVVPAKPGVYLDMYAATETLRNRLASSAAQAPEGAEIPRIELPAAHFAPRVSSEFVKSLEIGVVLSEYETHFSRGGDQARRGANIDNAARRIDGLILAPNEVVSFNNVVGDRSEANGFQRSWEIFKGEMVEGIGGGTCQVASTFHAASFFGGLDVLERLPHSRPSAYIPMGLDSTVVYPVVDLKLRNPHPFAVVVHAKTTANSLKVELLGREHPVTVQFAREVLGTIAFKRKIVEEASLAGNKVVHKQHGIRGYRIKRVRTITYTGGTSRVEATTDYYPATTDIFMVPVGFDPSKLPKVPGQPGDEKDETAAQASVSAEGAAQPCKGEGCVATATAEPAIEIVEGRGAHAPTAQQAAPPRSMRVAQ